MRQTSYVDFMKNNQSQITGALSATSSVMPPGKGGTIAKGALTGASLGTSIMPGIGTAVGAVIGTVGGAIMARKNEKKAQALRQAQHNMELGSLKSYSQSILSDYPTYGVEQNLYRNGGLLPLSDDLAKFVGPSHDQGGIDIGTAEVEGGEMIDDNNIVYSDTLEVSPAIKTMLKNLGI